MIWKSLIPPRFVRFLPTNTQLYLDEAIALRDTNHETRSIIERTYRVSFQEWQAGKFRFHLMDIDRDTFRTMDMQLPTIKATPVWPPVHGHPFALPIKKLMSLRIRTPGRSLALLHATIFNRPFFDLHTGYLPLLEELTLVFSFSTKDWWVPDFQEYGPHIINKPDEDLVDDKTLWTQDYGLARKSGAHFEKLGIRGDTGLRWPSPCQRTDPDCGHTHHGHLDWATGKNLFLSPRFPRIGLRGFSRDCVSMGGQWAGFRWFPATRTVEFSPLSWDEVKDAMYEGAKDNMTDFHQFPQLIIKVFIVREGKVPYDAPHHCWIKVLMELPGETDSMRTIRMMWRQVECIVFKQMLKRNTRMRVD